MTKNCIIPILITFFCFQFSFSQKSKDSIKIHNIEEIKINSTKISINKQQHPSQIEVISKAKIEFQNFQTTADALGNSGALFVQKSQQGGGSPVIRGFESSRILLLVDGIRMNNLIFRAGHLQNVITVDENFLDNIVIQYGPTSTLYGSDALGGSVNMLTKNTAFSSGFSGSINTRFSSANTEKSNYLDLGYGGENWTTFTAFSFNDFRDLRMGKKKNPHGDFFGERPYYVSIINGVDTIITNDNKYIQVNSGYKQYNFMQKLNFKTATGFLHTINFQYTTSSNIPRYDRLTDPSSSTVLKSAEWYYGPQKRVLGIYSIEKENVFTNTDMKIDLSYQNVRESRVNRNFGNHNLQNRIEKVAVYSLATNFETKLKNGNLYYGLETYYDNLKSSAFKKNSNTGAETPLDTRYPNGKNHMMRSDVYFSYASKRYQKTNWSAGARLGYTSLKSTIADNTFFPLPFSEIKQNNITYSGNIGLVHNASKNIILKTNLSSGFRVPNIDDLAKIFESGGGKIIVPNNNLAPEKTITTDLGLVLKTESNRHLLEATYFYTKMYDAIVTDKFTYEGNNAIIYNNTLSEVYANQNKGKAYVTGFNLAFKSTLTSSLTFDGSYSYTLGRVLETTNRPLDHIPPYFGRIGLNYSHEWGMVEAYFLFNGKKDIADYSTSGEDNPQYAPSSGMPAWETYNIKASSKEIYGFKFYVGVENILDTQYRIFASGINAAGRNIYGAAKYSF